MSHERASAEQKRTVIARAYECCEYCASQARHSMDPFAVEHIIPLSRGGKTTLDNLALACQGCNGSKYNKVDGYDAISEKNVPLYHPRHDKWQDHFAKFKTLFYFHEWSEKEYICERQIAIAEAGWIAGTAPLLLKINYAQLMWEDTQAANAMRTRIFELRYPSRLLEKGTRNH